MESEYWHRMWKTDDIGFHQPAGNPLLHVHFAALALPAGSRVFVPLCGKTRDIPWLMSQGHQVTGIELSELAVRQLFEDMGLEPSVSTKHGMTCYSATDVEVLVGDIFKLTRSMLGHVDAVVDRAALVALPGETRAGYAGHVADITGYAPQLLLTFEYDQAQMAGPPFSVSGDEVRSHYDTGYRVSQLASVEVAGKLKGKCDAMESVWLLRPRV